MDEIEERYVKRDERDRKVRVSHREMRKAARQG